MSEAFYCDAQRTVIGRYDGSLSSIRADDLAAIPIRSLVEGGEFDPAAIDDVILGCANQAGEDNRNIARMAALLAGLPETVDCAIALGHPLGMSGAKLVQTLVHQLEVTGGRFGLATLCVGVGQGLSIGVERI